jgi:cell division protein ZapA
MSMEEPKATGIRVNIFGTEYPIKGDADPTYIREVADYVDQKMRSIAKNTPMQSSLKVAILAALNIADELYKARGANDKALAELENRVDEIIDSIDKEFIED